MVPVHISEISKKDYRSGVFNFFNRFIMNGSLSYHPQRLYVYNPAICSSTVVDDICALPKLNESNPALKIIENVFDYRDNPVYVDKRIIYLTQPLDEVKGSIAGMHEALLEMLRQYQEKAIVRIHPRQKNVDTGGLAIDEVNNLWELEMYEAYYRCPYPNRSVFHGSAYAEIAL